MAQHVGIDLADVEEVRASVVAQGERYLARVFTDSERRHSDGRIERLAAQFAAKEATMKALRCEDRLPWRSIEVATDATGTASLALHGPAARVARERGVGELVLSLTRTSWHAAAVVVAR
ncbi:MAG: 4'-phosphopantetheinyl transferase superfamily protein [Solirubrobacterales bacterium]|nr:4'-phosphopantetheinyl transferase superfamily protein [Solirubrobacterales bacterium]